MASKKKPIPDDMTIDQALYVYRSISKLMDSRKANSLIFVEQSARLLYYL
jgi:hypothetical protein